MLKYFADKHTDKQTETTRAITERDDNPPPPQPAHCHRAGFGYRMQNGLVRVENTEKTLAVLKVLGYTNSAKFAR